LIDGVVGPEQVSEQSLTDHARRELAARVEVVVDARLEKAFPDQALAWVEIETTDGGCARSGISAARGDAGTLLRDSELTDKFRTLADPVLGSDCAKKLVSAIHTLPNSPSLNEIIGLLRLAPTTNARETQLESR
jgi:2-methylcitrate dehydratase PrpD